MPVPIVTVGATEKIGAAVIQGLQPEYEVILFCLTVSAACSEIPHLLKCEAPPEQSSAIGSGNFAQAPRAVVFGGAWSAEDVVAVVAAIKGCPGADDVVMLRKDADRPSPPLGPAYPGHIVQRVKDALASVLDGPHDDVVWY